MDKDNIIQLHSSPKYESWNPRKYQFSENILPLPNNKSNDRVTTIVISTDSIPDHKLGENKEVDTGGGVMDTGWEKYIDKLDREMTEIKQNTRASEERIAKMIDVSEQHQRDMWTKTLEELRDRDNQRHNEYIASNSKIDKIDNTVKWGLGIIAAIIIAGVTIIVSIIN